MQDTDLPPLAPVAGSFDVPAWRRPEILVAAILLAVALAFALTVDAVRNGYGIKGDEATYTAMTLSAAYDRDLTFERRDLERYWAVYTCGPDGVFLKKGKLGRWSIGPRWPFLRYMKWADAPGDKLYFGKAFIYPVFAAPLVWLFGLNGMLVFHVLLLAGVVACGYRFLSARGARAPALAFSLAFVGISIVPVYAVWLTPEIFNLSCVFYAYFLWLYKEVALTRERPGLVARFVRGAGSDLLAAALLGAVTFSKPLYALLVGPLVLWQLGRRRLIRATATVAVYGLVAGGLFLANCAVSGEFSYQGGYRKVFYTWFPFESPEMTFDTVGYQTGTNQLHSDVFDPQDYATRLFYNAGYFIAGRHAGLLPYFLPGLAALAAWLVRWREIRAWQVLALLGVLVSIGATLVILPYTWAGGGGPPGNRYFLGIYPVLFFLMPAVESVVPALLVWIGGAAFTAQLVLNPYFTARFPWRNVDHGAVRALPIELTMVNDLPIMLDRMRAPLKLDTTPAISVYLLDENAYPPEPAGLWISGRRRADVVVRTNEPLATMRLTLASPIANTVRVSFDGRATTVVLAPNAPVDVTIATSRGVYCDRGWGYVLSVRASDGMVPKNVEPGSKDRRFLGVLVKLHGTVRAGR